MFYLGLVTGLRPSTLRPLRLTRRALRRTFNDLARAAAVSDLVTRSISGHLTEAMQRHYSTVNGAEQRTALAKVIRLVDRSAPSARAAGGEDGGEGTPGGGRKRRGADRFSDQPA